jgi:hypothetical protein
LKTTADAGTDATLKTDAQNLVDSVNAANAAVTAASTAATAAKNALISAQTLMTTAKTSIDAAKAAADLALATFNAIDVSLYPVSSISGGLYSISGQTNALSASTLSYSASTLTLSASKTLTPGYYVMSTTYGIPNINFIRLTFTSNNYSCPFDSAFPDYYRNFQPCTATGQSQQPGFPCFSFNDVTKLCVACVSGY